MSLSSAQPGLLSGLSPSLTGVCFYRARRTRTQALDPDRWAQQGCILYWKDTNGATVVGDLFSDKLPRPVDSLTEGVFSFPIGEAPVEAV